MDAIQDLFEYINWLLSALDRILDFARQELGL